MLFQSEAISVMISDEKIAHLVFDLSGSSVNKFSRSVLSQLKAATDTILAHIEKVNAVIVSSAKSSFIVGADITEFLDLFALPDNEISHWLAEANAAFTAFEDLPVPTVAAVNGLALGGGFEMCLACDYRVLSTAAQVGFPEVRLGLFPGFGGTVRFVRIAGIETALEWICQGRSYLPEQALAVRAADAVAAPELLEEVASDLINRAVAGNLDWKARRQIKMLPVPSGQMEQMMSFTTVMSQVKAKAGKHYPAPVEAVKAIQVHVTQHRDQAISTEIKHFVKVAQTPVAKNLVGLFLNDQILKKKSRHYKKQASAIEQVATIGAGVMGSGIAQAALIAGYNVTMQDQSESMLGIAHQRMQFFLNEQVEKKRLSRDKAIEFTGQLNKSADISQLSDRELVIEAVTEDFQVKQQVLKAAEEVLSDRCILASNTSTIPVNQLANSLKTPERFCGLHFFNPVNKMPLVEVVRGSQTSEQTIADAVQFVMQLKKTPIVVNDCPGFYVNRVLFPYLAAFMQLLNEGVDCYHVDRVMTEYGWPMGPASLIDVVGIDVAWAVSGVMAKSYPDRMKHQFKSAVEILMAEGRHGIKTGKGFYRYEAGKKGKPVPQPENSLPVFTTQAVQQPADEEIIFRLMLPMCLEVVRCLEENIIATAAEADMALILGVGFPPYLGGPLRFIDEMGHAAFLEKLKKYKTAGGLYQPSEQIVRRLSAGRHFILI